MRRLGALVTLGFLVTLVFAGTSGADPGGACFRGRFGTTVDCGGGYVISSPGDPGPGPATGHSAGGTPAKPPVLAEYVANGPNGPCLALGPANPVPNATVVSWLATVHFPPCPTAGHPPGPPVDPVTLAVQFWRTIPLPVPRPSIPPGYAVTGKPAYLVTGGTVDPAPFLRSTPLGRLVIRATGSYEVSWGDGAAPVWNGPYTTDGLPWPSGFIVHTYQLAGTVSVTVREDWIATWSLAGATGTLTGLHTEATIEGFGVEQLQAVLTG